MIHLAGIRGSGVVSDYMGSAQGPVKVPDDMSEQSNNPPFWSPWNFQIRGRDWHEIFYDEMRSNKTTNEDT